MDSKMTLRSKWKKIAAPALTPAMAPVLTLVFAAFFGPAIVLGPPVAFGPVTAFGQEVAEGEDIGIFEQLGEVVPLDLTFHDEEGEEVTLRSLIKRPTVLTLVYFRCPSICSPLMHELAGVVDELDLEPGIDFDLVTISFDKREDELMVSAGEGKEQRLSKSAKKNLLGGMEKKLSPESWRFLTGDGDRIDQITRSVGFKYRRDGEDYTHAGTVIFLSEEGKIVRYLGGLKLLPADVKLALIDAAEGNPRSFMQRIQRFCYSYDSEGQTYVFQVNRIILFGTLFLLGLFVVFVLLKGKIKAKAGVKVEARPETKTERV